MKHRDTTNPSPSFDRSNTPGLQDATTPAPVPAPAAAARTGLLRVNTATAIIVVVVIALATAAVMAAIASARHAAHASVAQARAQQELWVSYLAQARAGRLSRVMGRRAEGLAAVTSAARIAGSLELRNEAIAHLALRDLTPGAPFIELTNAAAALINNSGTHAAIADASRRLRIIHLGSTQEVVNVRPSPSVRPIMFSPDDALLAASDSQGQLAVIDAATGRVLWRHANWRAVDFTPDSRAVAVLNRTGGKIHFLNATSGVATLLVLPVDPYATDLAISPAADRIALALSNRVEIISTHLGQPSVTFAKGNPLSLPIASRPSTMVWGGDWLAIGQHSGEIELFHSLDGRSYRLRGHHALVANLSFNHGGDLLASVSYDGSSKLWNPFSGREILSTTLGFGQRFTEHDRSLVFRTRNGIGAWKISHPQGFRELHLADSPSAQFHADISDDGNYLAVMKDDGLRLVHTPTGAVVARQRMVRGRAAYFLPGDRLLTCGDFRLSIWPLHISDSASGEAALGEPAHIDLPSREHVDTPTLNAARTHLAMPISHTAAMVMEINQPGNRLAVTNTPNPKLSALSPDGRWLVTGTFHGSKGTRLWNAHNGQFVRDLAPDNASVFFNPIAERRMLLVAGNREYLFFDTSTWGVTHRIPTESAGDLPNTGAFTADGATVALTTARSAIQLIDTRTFEPLATLSGPENNVVSWLTFDRLGETLAAVMTSDVVELWNLREIRSHLQPLGLDWSNPLPPPASRFKSPALRNYIAGGPALRSFSEGGPTRSLTLAVVAAVLLVIACAGFVLRRQRRLLAQYFAADNLVSQRNRELGLAQAEIMHSQKMKALGTLAAGIAHDFNNLLSVIRMSNRLIAREAHGNAEIVENTAEIENAVRQGKSVVSSMLGYSREASENSTTLAVAELVEDTVGLLSRQFLSGIALQLEIEPDLPSVHVSRGKLEQILLNLVVNASEAMDGKGSLKISVRRAIRAAADGTRAPRLVLRPRDAEGYIEIQVADSGPGMAPEVLPRIFEPFFTTKTVGTSRGTGLGLSMVHTMTEQEGIGIMVETALGKGTIFRLLIPVSKFEAHTSNFEIPPPVRQSHTAQTQ